MTKNVLIIIGVLIAAFLLLISPFLYDAFHSAAQSRALQHRSDFPQIAADCASLKHAMANNSTDIPIDDPKVSTLLRSLAPRSILASSNLVTLEFHGGFDRYGYRLRQAETNPKQWELYYYWEGGEKLLTTISPD